MKGSPFFFLAAIAIWAPHLSQAEADVWGTIALVLGYVAVWRES
jgi:hypothetical protein